MEGYKGKDFLEWYCGLRKNNRYKPIEAWCWIMQWFPESKDKTRRFDKMRFVLYKIDTKYYQNFPI